MFLLMFIGVYLFARLSLVLPSIAVGDEKSFLWSWNSTKNNGVRVVCATMLIPFAMTGAIEWIIGGVIWLAVLAQFIYLILMVYGIATLSISYSLISGNTEMDGEC